MEEDNKKSLEDRDSSIKINSDSLYSNISGRKIKESKRSTSRKRTFISTKWRWLILIFIGMIGFGMYFTQYNMDVLCMQISKRLFDKNFEYNILPQISKLCGIISSILAGILISKKKLRVLILVFSVTVIASQVLLTIVGYLGDNKDDSTPETVTPYILTFAGYALFGIGSEGSQVCEMSIIGMWFEKQEISTGFGIKVSILRLSFILNLLIAIEKYQLGPTFLIGLILCIISLFFGVISIRINAYSEKIDIQRKVYFLEDEEQKFHWRNMFNFGWTFWILCINCTSFYLSYVSFTYFSTDFLYRRYGVEVDFLAQYVFLISVLICPIFGYISLTC